MSSRGPLGRWARPIVYLGTNAVTLTGAVLTTSAALTMVGFWAVEVLHGGPIHSYAGILLFLVLPAVFVAGLLLIPVGLLWRRRRLRARKALPEEYPRIDLNRPVLRRAAGLVATATLLNVAILGAATYRGVEYMDSTQFCGLTCHTVMAPEYTAFVDSPHSRVGCVQCHIGAGASWFVRSKLSGARQVLAVAAGTYSRPIPSPVRELRPARETCETCHWPSKFHGDKLVVKTKYAEDEANTPSTSVLMLRIGGQGPKGAAGIHGRHLDATERIHYLTTDDKRQVIPRVRYRDDSGQVVEYATAEAPSADGAGEWRAMDCMDCHNRPSHAFDLPERGVDRAIGDGRISPTLPWARKETVRLLRADYPDRETAARSIAEGLVAFYRDGQPAVYRERRKDVDAAVEVAQAIYLRNVFPEMNVRWGTYANNVGHDDFPGCFRCHDDEHKTPDGRVITQDCSACHALLAMEETEPKVLTDLGLR
ncbi:MAG TPA: NapC/NirT family cytochrome c [Vicinamibacteria bacterium]|nr:NapC/NirT family cytochrome c [Vicinamibacteria bacterium]